MTNPPRTPWLETQATIVECRYQFARLNTLTLGIQTQKKFLITFNYYAHGHLYTGDFQSTKALLQDVRILVLYNPLNPAENSLATTSPLAGSPLLQIGIAGSILLSLAWFAMVHGCR